MLGMLRLLLCWAIVTFSFIDDFTRCTDLSYELHGKSLLWDIPLNDNLWGKSHNPVIRSWEYLSHKFQSYLADSCAYAPKTKWKSSGKHKKERKKPWFFFFELVIVIDFCYAFWKLELFRALVLIFFHGKWDHKF